MQLLEQQQNRILTAYAGQALFPFDANQVPVDCRFDKIAQQDVDRKQIVPYHADDEGWA